ncbi:MAG: hypothetical protein JST01_15490 [Cyanobacteria bacterium SZAS TMP-1]|nr:hypothetical protein [Cyanobacteria bacterium SZAS TMP-1]
MNFRSSENTRWASVPAIRLALSCTLALTFSPLALAQTDAPPRAESTAPANAAAPATQLGVSPQGVLVRRPTRVARPQAQIQPAKQAATMVSGGNYLGAIQVWSRVIQLGPDKVQGYLQRAKLKRQIGDTKGAILDLDVALQLAPTNVACLMERAAIRKRLNDSRGALDDLNKVIELQPQKAEAYIDRGWARMATGDYVGSYTDYHTAVTLNPSLKGKVGGLGQPQISARLDVDANGIATRMEREKERDDEKPGEKEKEEETPAPVAAPHHRHHSHGHLARLNNAAVKQINAGQFEEAIKTLHELMDDAPNYAHARDNLTIAYNNWGLELAKRTPAEAAKQFRLALYLDPSQGASRRNLDAMIREIGKNPKEANDRLQMAQENLAAGDARSAFVEATEAEKLKNSAAVRATLRKVLSALAREDEMELKAEARQETTRQETARQEAAKQEAAKPAVAVTPQPTTVATAPVQAPVQLATQPATQAAQPTEQAMAEAPPEPAPINAETTEDDEARLIIIEQAKAMANAGQVNDAEELLTKLINHIKSKAAVNESAGFHMLDLALDTLSQMYIKSGNYSRAQSNMSELITLRESTKDAKDPLLGTTYRQYARVLNMLKRTNEANAYEAKAESILDTQAAQR